MTRYLVSIAAAVEKGGDFADLDEALAYAERETPRDGTFTVAKLLVSGAPRILVSRSPGNCETSDDRKRRAKENDARYC